jgi:hypothetical protein
MDIYEYMKTLETTPNYDDEFTTIKKIIITNKTYEEGTIMKGRSDLKKKGSKYEIETEININNDINDKVKRALIKSIIEELNKNFDDYEFFYQKKN